MNYNDEVLNSKVVSLSEKRRQKKAQAAQLLKPSDRRIQELEEDMLRVIDQLIDLSSVVEEQAARLKRYEKYLLKAVQTMNAASSS